MPRNVTAVSLLQAIPKTHDANNDNTYISWLESILIGCKIGAYKFDRDFFVGFDIDTGVDIAKSSLTEAFRNFILASYT